MRLKILRMKNNSILSEQIRENFSAIEGINCIETNPVTGSVLLYYNPKQIATPDSTHSILKTFASLFPEIDSDILKNVLKHLQTGQKESTKRKAEKKFVP